MNRDEFEAEYVNRHLRDEPSEASSIISLRELRNGNRYDEPLIDLCWKCEQWNNQIVNAAHDCIIPLIEW